ncbi:hypothetical protein PF011_g25439 [Phytophthora fragariae]|uniref:Uncharacterized protein n=1 Tax=Phytophthora fragariae TaxID=53985 RepID=A0A6A3HYS9_9STRA|nr:hypothetical protein PF011_g25439 [Phytophthora fragariae]
MVPIRWAGSLLLLCCVGAVRSAADQVAEMDALLVAKMEETQRAYAAVAQQLSAASQVADLSVLEDAQLQLLAVATRTKLAEAQAEVRREMQTALQEVEALRRAAVGNATAWRETVEGLRAATRAKRQALQQMRLQKEIEEEKGMERKAQRELEMLQELETQREEEVELELRAQEELEKLQEVERRQEEEKKKKQQEEKKKMEEENAEHRQRLEKMQELERQQELEKRQETRQQEVVEGSRSDSSKDGDVGESARGGEHNGTVKRLLDIYVSWERVVQNAAATIYRQLVLPVVAILGFFFVLTVAIARYNSMKQARRNRRVLYSGYPKTYQRKIKQEPKTASSENDDLRPRYRNPATRRDPNNFIED